MDAITTEMESQFSELNKTVHQFLDKVKDNITEINKTLNNFTGEEDLEDLIKKFNKTDKLNFLDFNVSKLGYTEQKQIDMIQRVFSKYQDYVNYIIDLKNKTQLTLFKEKKLHQMTFKWDPDTMDK